MLCPVEAVEGLRMLIRLLEGLLTTTFEISHRPLFYFSDKVMERSIIARAGSICKIFVQKFSDTNFMTLVVVSQGGSCYVLFFQNTPGEWLLYRLSGM